MMPCPWVPEIAKYLKQHPDMDSGLHLTLTSEWSPYRWQPLAGKPKVPGLVDGEGCLWHGVEQVAAHATPDEIESEIRAQLETGSAPAPPPPAEPAPAAAAATGAAAAAETPSRSSSFFTRAAASNRLRATICSSNCTKSAIFFSNQKRLKFLFPASNPDRKFPMRQTRALSTCTSDQIL